VRWRGVRVFGRVASVPFHLLTRRAFVAVAALLVGVTLPPPARAIDLPVTATTLGNGMMVLVHEDHSAPVISSYIFYRCGSRNERPGQTGIAHLFEHMMFNGGKKFGPGQFDDLIEGNGGSTNGFTTRDLTAYLNNFPTEALPIVLDLEADRMRYLAITQSNLEQERGIVAEERRLRIDNDVQGSMDEALYLHAFLRSSYRWNTVGFMADIQRITLREAKDYFAHCYAPNNAIMVLAGDLDAREAFARVGRAFGAIPRAAPPAPVDAQEPEQAGERRVVVRRVAELPAVMIGYKGVRATDADRPALEIAAQVLSGGESARLDRDLVRERELATAIQVDPGGGIDPDLFTFYAQARPGKTTAQIEARIEAIVGTLVAQGVGDDELRRAKRQLRAGMVKGLKTVSGKASQLGFSQVVFGDYRAIAGMEAQWEAVTADDVRRVVGRYLVKDQRTVVTLEPLARDGAAR
jgi:zinc protease